MTIKPSIRVYARRDSATSVLRKIGIKARDYNIFIKEAGGEFHCDVEAAEQHLASLDITTMAEVSNPPREESTEAEPVAKPKNGKAVMAEVQRPKQGSVSTVARDMIIAGHTNQEVWAKLKELFDLDDKKKSYPSWYRSELKRKGVLV